MPTFTTQHIADHVGGELIGPGGVAIHGVEQIEGAKAGQLTFIGDEKYAKLWPGSRASAALVSKQLAASVGRPGEGRALILVPSADLAMAAVLALFAPPMPVGGMGEGPVASPLSAEGSGQKAEGSGGVAPFVHPAALVDPTARLGAGVRIGANSVIGPGVTIGDRTVVYSNVTILDDSALGSDCVIWPGVVIRERCTLGRRCILHPNVTIGADGFGYRPSADGKGLAKIPQIGTVEIGDDVELGAGSCVDRGKFSATVIGDGCKIDNLCQIAHNCRLGRCVIIAGQAGLAGSVTVGDGVMIGGHAAVGDHLTIGAGAVIMAFTGVMRDVEPGVKVAGVPAREVRQFFRETASVAKLPDVMREIKRGKA